jgi:3-isopropylmalate/(R)-2-methylmalate dehydratase large subunit
MSTNPQTLFDKVWDAHVVKKVSDGPDVLFIDRHFIHEVTSPVAFLGLKTRGVGVMFPEKIFATNIYLFKTPCLQTS